MKCSYKDCRRSIQGHKWAKIRAQEDGWFFGKNGDIWCPDHNPSWVTEWRNNARSGTRV